MILKIQDAINKSKWYYYDNIAKISFNHDEYEVTKGNLIIEKTDGAAEAVTLDADAVYAAWANCKRGNDNELQCGVVVAIFRSLIILDDIKSGDEMCVAFNGRAYLLNDEGRTIERIS